MDTPHDPSPPPAVRRSIAAWWLIWLVPGLIVLGIGLANRGATVGQDLVDAIRVQIKPTFSGQAAESVERLLPGKRDYYLIVHLPDHKLWKSDVYDDTPIGGGLSWTIEPPLPLRDVGRIEIWDANLISDDLEDHVTPEGARAGDGQTFRFDLRGQQPQPLAWPTVCLAIGGAICAVSLVGFLWKQAL